MLVAPRHFPESADLQGPPRQRRAFLESPRDAEGFPAGLRTCQPPGAEQLRATRVTLRVLGAEEREGGPAPKRGADQPVSSVPGVPNQVRC